MKFPFGENTTISRLRVPYSGDQLAARLRYARLFGAMDLHPASLPPNAVVCIRKLRNTPPRNLQIDRAARRFSDDWRDAVSREIENLYRRAYRPIRETVPARAESIIFADYAELLASLANDFCKGDLIRNWWWRSLFPNLERAQTIARIWIESVEFAPTALQILSKKGKAAEFAAKLQPAEVSEFLRQMIKIFGLNKLPDALFESSDKPKKTSVQPEIEKTEKRDLKIKAELSAPVKTAEPWLSFVPEADHAALRFEQKALLGIGLMLARAPRFVRSDEFARQVKLVRIETETGKKQIVQSREITGGQIKETKKPPPKIEKESRLAEDSQSQTFFPESKAEAKKSAAQKAGKKIDPFESAEKTPEKSFDAPDERTTELPPPKKTEKKSKIMFIEESREEQISKPAGIKKSERSARDEKREMPEIVPDETVEESETEFEYSVETRFGGVFYLLNLGLYLKLYSDFSEPLEQEIDLNIWDFVALLGFEFLGRKIKRDPVWHLLKKLAGREIEEDFGRDFYPPDEWRIPTDWLETFQTERKWRLFENGKRLIVRHPEKFNVIDVSLDVNREEQLENELKIYGEYFSELVKGSAKKNSENLSPAERWLKNLTEYAERRLLQALNLKNRRQMSELMFERNASVTVTATHFETTFRLADLPFEIRQSGLDRDPGWIPAAGKYIKFHFV